MAGSAGHGVVTVNELLDGFRRSVSSFAEANHIPVVRFKREERKADVMRPYLQQAAATGRSQVAAIGVAQEPQIVWTARQRGTDPGKPPQFSFSKENRRVTACYFYLWDEAFGPAFIKICACFPYPVKVWVNGHEWAKRQAIKAGIAFTELSSGFAATSDPDGLQAICDRLQPGTIGVFFARWMARLPVPLTPADQAAGFWWEPTMRQVEVSRTLVFAAPRHTRAFFEALVADNLDLGRPERTEIIFKRSPPGAKAGGVFKTAIDRHATAVTLNIYWKHSRIKQYMKDGRALRIETVINDAYDLTPDGLKFAIFYTKVCDRILAPLFAAGQPQAPPQLRAALRTIEHHIDDRITAARLPTAA